MAYARIETSVRTHKKFLNAGPAACWLWACGLMYCQETLTDGRIPDVALELIGVKGAARARRLAADLVKAGLWDVVEDGWQVHDYLEHNKSADEVRAVQVERRKAGSTGGRPKKQIAIAHGKQVALANEKQPENPSPSTPTATNTDTGSRTRSSAPSAPERLNGQQWEGFEAFWAVYPRKTAKASARKAWGKLKPDQEMRAQLTSAVERQTRSPQWQEANGRFIPHAATWLNGGRWQDEFDIRRQQQPDESSEQWVQRVGYCRHQPRCESAGTGECLARWRAGEGR